MAGAILSTAILGPANLSTANLGATRFGASVIGASVIRGPVARAGADVRIARSGIVRSVRVQFGTARLSAGWAGNRSA